MAFIVSANIHRRHLTAEQKRDLIAALLKATPEKSDRQIAKTVKASPTTVGTVRTEMEARGDVSKLDTRQDSKGRRQPAKTPHRGRLQTGSAGEQGRRAAAGHRKCTGRFRCGEPDHRCLGHRQRQTAAGVPAGTPPTAQARPPTNGLEAAAAAEAQGRLAQGRAASAAGGDISTRRRQPKAQLQRAVLEHLRWRGQPNIFFMHYPAGGYRSPVEAMVLKGLGVQPACRFARC